MGNVLRSNNGAIIKMISYISVEENQGRSRTKTKQIEVSREDKGAYEVRNTVIESQR